MMTVILHDSAKTKLAKINPQDSIETILETALVNVEKTMRETVVKIQNAATNLILKASEQTVRIIANLKVAYGDLLKTTYERSEKIKQNIDQLYLLVKDIVEKNDKALEKIDERITEITKYDKMDNSVPIITEITPHFFANDGAENATTVVTFLGNFSSVDSSTVHFKLNGKTYRPETNEKEKCTFKIDVPTADVEKCTYLTGQLCLTWCSGYLSIWSSKNSTFKTFLRVLPLTMGKISVNLIRMETVKKVSDYQCSITKNKKPITLTCKPSDGYKIAQGTARLTWIEISKKVSARVASSDDNQITFEIDAKKGSGKVLIVFDEVMDIEVPRTVKSDLKWGMVWTEKLLVLEKIKRIVFEAFNGAVYEFPKDGNVSNPFFELIESEGSFQIKARSATEINNSKIGLDAKKVGCEKKEQKSQFPSEKKAS